MTTTQACPTRFLGVELTDLLVASGTDDFEVVGPLDAEVLARIPRSSSADLATAIDTARDFQPRWARVPVGERAGCLLRFHDLLLDHQSELLDLICLETGKARLDAFYEVVHLALTARYYGRRAERLLASHRGLGALPVSTRVDINRIPKGVVGLITPWNYPLTMGLCDGLAAIVAGNTIVHKPDSQTVLSSLAGQVLLQAAGVPAQVWQTVAGPGSELGPQLIEGTDMVCFTGSTATGRKLAEATGAQLKSISAELGGKNALIVRADADLDAAAAGAARACFNNAGQMCVHIERIYVDQEIYEAFRTEFIAAVEDLRLAAGLGWETDIGTLVSPDQLDKVTAHLEDAVAKGAKVLTGGKARPDLAPWCFEPTVLEGVTADADCHLAETFGPLVALYPVSGDEAAIRAANQGRQGLNAAIWTSDHARGRELARRLHAGTVNINDGFAAALASLDAPMGGMGESGMGRRQGAEGLHRFTETQTVATQRLIPLAPFGGLDAAGFAGFLTKGLRVLKAIGRP